MFSGIIEAIGRLNSIETKQEQWRLAIEFPVRYSVRISDSVSINGICLTAAGRRKNIFFFDVLNETYSKTNLKFLKPGSRVNLEQSLRAGSRMGGHFVTGHIDGMGEIQRIVRTAREITMTVQAPKNLMKYFAFKGSVSLNGISLTVGKINQNFFEVYLIPYTIEHTNLGESQEGDLLNLEVDILARYARNEKSSQKSGITMEFLKKHGFC